MELPRYLNTGTAHVVNALTIFSVEQVSDNAVKITPAEKGYAEFCVALEDFNPRGWGAIGEGWYYVVRSDGSTRYFPPSIFEKRYVSLHHKKFNPLKKRCNYRKLLREWYAALRGLFWL